MSGARSELAVCEYVRVVFEWCVSVRVVYQSVRVLVRVRTSRLGLVLVFVCNRDTLTAAVSQKWKLTRIKFVLVVI